MILGANEPETVPLLRPQLLQDTRSQDTDLSARAKLALDGFQMKGHPAYLPPYLR